MPTSLPGALPSKLREATLHAYNGNTGPMSKILGDIGEDIEALAAKIGIDGSSVSTSFDYMHRQVETSYTPVASSPGSTLTQPATWTGSYFRPANGKIGRLSIRGVATGTWSGTGFVELTLPSGWTAAAARECASGIGLAYPAVGFGQHALVYPVLHAGATKLRFVSRGSSADGYQFAIDGIGSPFAVGNGDTVFDGCIEVRLA